MARQTSFQVTTIEPTFFLLLRFSGPQTILTVFGYSFWLREWNQQYFVPQLNIRPETINTDQIPTNAI